MDVGTCSTCRFWVEREHDPSGVRVGHCRRYPPVYRSAMEVATSIGELSHCYAFPVLSGDQWCGERQPRKPLPVVCTRSPEFDSFLKAWGLAWRAKLATFVWPAEPRNLINRTRKLIRDSVEWPDDYAAATECVRSCDVMEVVRKAIGNCRGNSEQAKYLRAFLAANGHPET